MCLAEVDWGMNGAFARSRLLETVRLGSGTRQLNQALSVLGHRVERGDAEVVQAALEHFSHESTEVRHAAVYAVGRVARVGSADAIEALLTTLADAPQPEIRQQAAEGLRWITPRGTARVITELCYALGHDPDDAVRIDAADALAEIAERGDAKVLGVLVAQLSGAQLSEDMHLFLLCALGKLAPTGDPQAVGLLGKGLRAGEAARRAAGEALEHLFGKEASLPVLGMFLAKLEEQECRIEELEYIESDPAQPEADAGADRGPNDGTASPSSHSESYFISKILAKEQKSGTESRSRSPRRRSPSL